MNSLRKILNGKRPGLSFTALFAVSFLALSYVSVIRWNPEMIYWSGALKIKEAWRDKLEKEDRGPVVVAFGGSTTGFGIDARFATEDLDYPMVNLGLHAGMGAEALCGFALAQAREGDTLLVMLEPFLLSKESSTKALGIQLAFASGQSEILEWRGESASRSRMSSMTDLRPGARLVFSLVGKVAIGRALYRYQIEDIGSGGLLVTDVRDKIPDHKEAPTELSESGRESLEDLTRVAKLKQINVRYALPWAYSKPEFTEKVRKQNETFLQKVEEIMPVIREAQSGVHPVREDFADTPQHLVANAARKRTASLVRSLRQMPAK